MDININIFPVTVNGPLNLFQDERKKYTSLKELRRRFSCSFYADGDRVFAYGKEASELTKIGFKPISKDPAENPKTTCRLILEGFCDKLRLIGYSVEPQRFIMQAFDVKNPIPLSVKELRLVKGCEFRTVYLKNILTNSLIFGIILDLKFKIEYDGMSCSYRNIRDIVSLSYGYVKAKDVIKEIRIKTGDLTPTGKMNAQASKFRYESILKVMEHAGGEINLPDGSKAIVSTQPTPIIIEV